VVDRTTGQGINWIKVTCQPATGFESVDYSDFDGVYDGGFWLENDHPCATVLLEDVDGTANGSYQSRTVPLSEVEDDGIVELDPTATP